MKNKLTYDVTEYNEVEALVYFFSEEELTDLQYNEHGEKIYDLKITVTAIKK